ncbi:hypothetical protein EVAR_33855_1 [Eumeta japonica]|uniref:Uncharacterized protein n=1 Tax=Eumeta variegata TaxID=151549 RepID=A0A4C1X8C6_EUMVA|nr:hypothetical protein EVAR_33855_1 [Eumeta japonica]
MRHDLGVRDGSCRECDNWVQSQLDWNSLLETPCAANDQCGLPGMGRRFSATCHDFSSCCPEELLHGSDRGYRQQRRNHDCGGSWRWPSSAQVVVKYSEVYERGYRATLYKRPSTSQEHCHRVPSAVFLRHQVQHSYE